jgi:glycosyltransferase involved in cell wall biosynthesis
MKGERKGINIVAFPIHDWKKCEKEGFRTRDAHLIQHFQRNKDVRKILVIDRPTSLPEILRKRYWWRIKGGRIVYKKRNLCLTQVSENLHVLDILSFEVFRPVLLRRGWWKYKFEELNIIKKIKEALDYLNLDNPILFLWNPLSTGVIGRLNEKMVVFDAMDNWLKHPEIREGHREIEECYQKIKEEADLIFTNSEALKLFFQDARSTVFCIPNGVDLDFFRSPQGKIPDDIKGVPKPIVGYAGKLARRIDVDLLRFISTKLPKVSFVLIGQTLNARWVRPLFRLKNIYFLGDKHYSLLPDYLQAFDVCMIPHNVGKLENEGDPIKLYEYLSAGKPVVTTNIAGVKIFKDIIIIAETKEEFLTGLKKYLQILKKGNGLSEKLKKSISPRFYWSNKAKMMISLIIEKMEGRERL